MLYYLITNFDNLLLQFSIGKRKQIITKGGKRRYYFHQLRNGAVCFLTYKGMLLHGIGRVFTGDF